MEITAAMVKELREVSGAGMMDCKKALNETAGDMEKAIEYLRENGKAVAQKKAGRIAAEGIVMLLASDDNKSAVAVEVNSETDFVAKNEKFQSYVKQVCEQALASSNTEIEAFLAEPWKFEDGKTVQESLEAQIAVIGENMNIRRFIKVEEPNGFVSTYTHMGGKIGVIIDVETDVINDEVVEMGKNIAMQAAAMSPQYTTREELSDEFIAKEREIIRATIMNDPDESKKPENVINGMVEGRLNKELKDIVLMDQVYVKAEDGKQTVGKYIQEVAKAVGGNVAVKRFVRFETGEGLEKKVDDFAAEVAAQAGQ